MGAIGMLKCDPQGIHPSRPNEEAVLEIALEDHVEITIGEQCKLPMLLHH